MTEDDFHVTLCYEVDLKAEDEADAEQRALELTRAFHDQPDYIEATRKDAA